MTELEIMQQYFSTGSATQEKNFIADVFVINENFEDIIMPASRSIRLLVGSKGSGKSALLEYLYQRCLAEEIPAISLSPIDIEIEDISGDAANFVLVQKIYKALVREIAIKIGSGLGGAITDEQESLVKEAVDAGVRQPQTIDSLLRILSPIGKAISNIDFDKMLPELKTSTRVNVSAINNTLPQQGKIFYVLFDDIDLFGNAGSKNYIDTIWCAILAFKTLAERLPNIRTIVTLRNEIWRQIRDNRQNARDQVDHVRPMIRYLLPTTTDMKKILNRRLEYCKSFLDTKIEDNYAPFFENSACKMPSSDEKRLWEDYLVISSRERPRDTVQLVQHLVSHALRNGRNRINDVDVEETALLYSSERVDDLVNESADLCPQLEIVIRSFTSVDFQASAEDVKTLLLGIPGKGRIVISGKALSAGNMDDMFKLWKILYDIEFLTPRAKDVTQPKGFTHIRPSTDSTLVSSARWNDMQKYIWEIHPCYRSYLIDIRNQNRKMIGFR